MAFRDRFRSKKKLAHYRSWLPGLLDSRPVLAGTDPQRAKGRILTGPVSVSTDAPVPGISARQSMSAANEATSTSIVAANAETLERAADLLCAGELVAFPTETVYGL